MLLGAAAKAEPGQSLRGELSILSHIANNGLQFCKSTLRERLSDRGIWCVIFDIDNTLVDTRHRTLFAARSFAKQHPEASSLERISLDEVQYDGRQTAQRALLGPAAMRAFQSHWNEVFWNPNSFKLDRSIRQTVQLVRQAKVQGAEIFYLTGRIEAFKPATLRQLRRLGLPDAHKRQVICKPRVGVPTAQFKQQTVEWMVAQGRDIGWFMSDSRKDVAQIQQGPRIVCVWVDFPVRPAGRPTPIEPSTHAIRLR